MCGVKVTYPNIEISELTIINYDFEEHVEKEQVVKSVVLAVTS